MVGQSALWAGMQELQQEDLEKAEAAGFPAILIVLLVVFGSVLAALLPVGLGVAAVLVTGAAVYFLALATTMSVFVTNVASMLGIGVAVDYSLFLLSRYREEIHRGHDRAQALDVAMRTSGSTVVFSGVTVLISMAGLFLLNSTVMRSLAIGAMVVVAIAVLGAITLLPALIAVLRAARRRAGPRGERHRRAGTPGAPPARRFLGALDGARDAPAVAVCSRGGGDPAGPGDPGALARLRQRRAADVPARARDAARRRAGRAGHRSRSRLAGPDRGAGPARRLLRAAVRHARRGGGVRAAALGGRRRGAPPRGARHAIPRAPRRSRSSSACARRRRPASTSAAPPPRRWTSTT